MNRSADDAPAEERLVLLAARGGQDEASLAAVRALIERSPDWRHVLRLSGRHRVIPLVHMNLKELGDSVPESVQAILARRFRENAMTNLAACRILQEVTAELADRGLEALVIKGPVLALDAYGSLSMRTFTDVDLLVREGDASQAISCLEQLGYRRPQEPVRHEPRGHDRPGDEYHVTLLHPDQDLAVEVHWRLAPSYFPYRPQLERWFERARKLPFQDSFIRAPALEDELLYLCVHGAKHAWQRLSWISDIAELVRRQPHIEWDSVRERARSLGAQRMLALGLVLPASMLAGPTVPDMPTDRAVTRLSRCVRRTIFTAAEPNLPSFYLDVHDRYPDKIRLLRYFASSWLKGRRAGDRSTAGLES